MVQESQTESLEDKTEEQIKFRANEELVNSKAFLLFTVDVNTGEISYVEYTLNLNKLELVGFNDSIPKIICSMFETSEEEEETDEEGEEEET